MFITTQSEIISLMPTARWGKPEELFGYLEEEERVALEPLLGTTLYQWLCDEYVRLRDKYVDITATTIKPTHRAKANPAVPFADVTERLDALQDGLHPYQAPCVSDREEENEVPSTDMQTVRLLRICQCIEWYKMLSHKAGLLSVSFNAGGGLNRVSADGYEPASDKDREEMRKDAFMASGRAIDSLLLFLEADAKGNKQFTEKWQDADAFYLHKDLLFQTARMLDEYLDINKDRKAYVALVRDIRFCQNTYLKPRIGAKLLQAVVAFANKGEIEHGTLNIEDEKMEQSSTLNAQCSMFNELLSLLRIALAFYVESRRTTLGPKDEKLARRDSMTDAQQAMAAACQYVEENLDAFGEAAVGSPIYNKVKEQEQLAQKDAVYRAAIQCRQRKASAEQNRRKLFTAFPATHRTPELKH